MKRLVPFLLAFWPVLAFAQFAPQVWTAPQDGDNNACYDVDYFQANNMAGFGVSCVHVDNNGKMTATGVDCGAGAGGVSSVTGTAAHISATPTTGAVVVDLIATAVTPGTYVYATFTVDADGRLTAASSGTLPVTSVTGTAQRISVTVGTTPVVDTIGGFYSGALAGGNENLGSNASGVEQQVTTAGVAVLSTYAATPGLNQFGAASNGGLAQDSNWVWDPTNHRAGIRVASPTQPLDVNGAIAFGAHAVGIQPSLVGVDVASVISSPVFYPNSGTNVWTIAGISPRGTGASGVSADFFVFGTDFIADQTNFEFGGMRSLSGAGATVIVGSGHSGTGTPRPLMLASDYLTNDTTNANQILLNTDGSVVLGIGALRDLAVAAPSTPSAGYGAIYVDSTSKNICLKNDAGTVNHGIQTVTCGANTFGSATTDAGGFTCTQPAFSNLSGTLTCGQSEGPWTGDVSKAANSCATALVRIPNDVSQVGDILVTNIVAPATPAAGVTRCYVDATSKNGACKNDAGTVNHGIQTQACAAHQWISSISDAGGSACVQPAYSDLAGSVPAPLRLVYTAGGRDGVVSMPSAGVGTAPDFWMRPMSYTDSTTSYGFYTFGQVWEQDAGDAFTTADLNVYVYQCAITVSAGPGDSMIFEITKNGARTGFNVTVPCPGGGTTNTNYRTTGNSLTIAATDRVGVEGYDTSAAYNSGALRATVTLVLRP